MSIRLLLPVIATVAAVQAPELTAQVRPPVTMEWRAEGIAGRGAETLIGGGVGKAVGTYARLTAAASAGAHWQQGGARPTGRLDALARFVLDPFRESRYGLSLGAGASLSVREGGASRAFLAALVELEGNARPGGNRAPAIQVGLGGGVRLAVLLRTAPARWR